VAIFQRGRENRADFAQREGHPPFSATSVKKGRKAPHLLPCRNEEGEGGERRKFTFSDFPRGGKEAQSKKE